MVALKFSSSHNIVAFLDKPTESDGFEQIVYFLNAHPIKYALTVNPTIYTSCIEQFWTTAKVKTVNREVQIQSLVRSSTSKDIFESRFSKLLDPHHNTLYIIQPSTSQPSKKQKPRKPKRKDTEVPQPSGPIENVEDEVVYEEMDDNLERATTTATSLDAEQIGHQETIGDTIAQTGFESVSKLSNDPLLARGNTLRSEEDSLKLKELMELCTNLQNRVIDLEKTKTSQAQEITNMFGVHDLVGDEVVVETEVASKDANLSVDEVTLAQVLIALKSAKPKVDKVMLQEPEQGTITTTTAATTITSASTRTKAKGLVIHD
ncbi:hypothetical protein Tco_0873722 [Tanacetum coccineum]|uniref:Xylulose kinase-1 n=1 Tax=Tanacetum coccineum TaxID=301880 RepID=A0ABQ5BMS5_9ASTR